VSAFSPFFTNASQIRLRTHRRKFFLKTRFYITQKGLLVWGGSELKAEITFNDQSGMNFSLYCLEAFCTFISKLKKKNQNVFFKQRMLRLILTAAGLLCCFEEMVFEKLNREIKIQML